MKYTFWHSSLSEKEYVKIYHPRSLLAINPKYAQWFSFDVVGDEFMLLLKLTCGYKYWGKKGHHHLRHENQAEQITIGRIDES
jgi:hypothetical protein